MNEEQLQKEARSFANSHFLREYFLVPKDGMVRAFIAGAQYEKEQMMKGAIYCVAHPDTTVCGIDTDVPFIRLGSVALGSVGVKAGDAVKVIVIKED